MNSNGNTSLWASTMVFGLLLFAVYVFLTSTNPHSGAGTSKTINTPQPSASVTTNSQFAPAQSTPAQPVLSQSTYDVKSGDTMSSIAAQTGVPLSALEADNPQVGANNLIYPGEAINLPPIIPITGGSAQASVDPYTVQPGDTLASLARRFNTSIDTLLRANPQITTPRLIRPGQQIVIP